MVIGFSDVDYTVVLFPHTNALVVTLTIANHNIHHILVDSGSSTDNLYWSMFKKMNLVREMIILSHFPLMEVT